MNAKNKFPIHGLAGLALAGFFSGCVSEVPMAVVNVPSASINGQPIHLGLDTGSGSTILFSSGAERVGLKYSPPVVNAVQEKASVDLALADPANITVDNQNFTAPLPVFNAPWYVGWALSLLGDDGLLGWPEVRNDILTFDSNALIVRGTDEGNFTPEPLLKDGWQKFKVSWGDQLMLEIPLADGKTGTVLVDTGSPMGVGLTAAQYKEWRAAHPKALTTSRGYYMPGVGMSNVEEAWADEIKIGTLTLTDVPVQEVPPDEAAGIAATGIDNFAGTIGLYGLSRMGLVVDGKNGYAYLKVKPPPGPSYPGLDRPGFKFVRDDDSAGDKDWRLASSVRIQNDNLYFVAGADKYQHGDFAEATADFNHALEINPQCAMAHYGLGVTRQCQGDFAGAVAEYDQAIALKDKMAPIAFAYVSIYRELLQLRLGQAPADFAQSLDGWRDGWAKSVGQFLAGNLDEKALLAAAQTSDLESVLGQQCEAYYFIGAMRLLKNDKAGALEYWRKCVDTKEKAYDEYPFARTDLARLDAAAPPHP